MKKLLERIIFRTLSISIFLCAMLSLTAASLPGMQQKKVALPPRKLTVKELAQQALPSIVTLSVIGDDGHVFALGSGFVIAKDVIATNKHVIVGAHRVTANFLNGQSVTVKGLINADEQHDLVLLRADTKNTQPLPLADGHAPAIGDTVVALGSPEGLQGSVSTGIVSGLRTIDETQIIQTSAPISHGSSGGPLLDEYGRVIGVTSFNITDGQNLNFAYSWVYVRQMLSSLWDTCLTWDTIKNGIVPPLLSRQGQEYSKHNYAFDEYLRKRNYVSALKEARAEVEIEPGNYQSHMDLGMMLGATSDDAKAVSEFLIASSIKPHDYNIHKALADTYYRLKDLDHSLAEYQIMSKIKPCFDSFSLVGLVGYENKQYAVSIAAYQEAAKLNPSPKEKADYLTMNAMLYLFIGQGYRGNNNLENAILSFRQSLQCDNEAQKLFPNDPLVKGKTFLADAHLELGVALLLTKKKEMLSEATIELETASQLDPSVARTHMSLSICYGMTNRTEEERRELKAVLATGSAQDITIAKESLDCGVPRFMYQ